MESGKSIRCSIIIPAYNREKTLRRCLTSLGNQDYPRDKFEIIVVDDGSSDGTVQMLSNLAKKYRNLRYIKQFRKGPASARNLGAKHARGEIIGFTDDDCVLSKDWIKLMVDSHGRNPEFTAVGGLTSVSNEKNNIIVSQFLSNCSIQIGLNGGREIIFFPTCNVSFKKGIFNKYKFDEKFPLPGGEDLEFFWRLFKDGHKFLWNKDIRVTHYRNETLNSFIRQAHIYGRGNLLTRYLHNDHPLLKELKTGKISFWLATLVNIIKIPRFSFFLGRRLIKENNIRSVYKIISVYSYFTLHKIFYIFGNIWEFFRIRKKAVSKEQTSLSMPRLLILDITHSCNLTCKICDIWKTGSSEQDMDFFHIKKMLLQAKEAGIKEIALSGGEPLLRQDIFDVFEYARTIRIKNLGVLTNGILIGRYIDRLKPYLIDGTISLVVSFDSLRPYVHNDIRNSHIAWQETMGSLNTLSNLKKDYPQTNFNVIAIILNQNLEELPDLVNFIKSMGANSLQLQVLLPNNLRMAERRKSAGWITKERLPVLDGVIDELIELKEQNSQFIRNSPRNLFLMKKYYRGTVTSGDVRCHSARETVLVSNRGNCTTCFSSYGNIRKQSLKDIFKSKERVEAQEKVKRCSWPCLLPCFCDIEYEY